MGKIHNNEITIVNQTGYQMEFFGEWFDSGRVADGNCWPHTIGNGEKATILCYERDWAWAGCSGYVQYRLCGDRTKILTIGFSNPSVGNNKVGVGFTGKQVWDNMTSNNYRQHQFSQSGFSAVFHCTGGETNVCRVELGSDHPSITAAISLHSSSLICIP
ncbi:uncharacterized protein [Clytia hemisphaerica]|uniref:Uncharacterized protein n=1 Tax=Clytia hemisphaerica TaxID=252671 RepID=A0A7M5UPZ0_9CNID